MITVFGENSCDNFVTFYFAPQGDFFGDLPELVTIKVQQWIQTIWLYQKQNCVSDEYILSHLSHLCNKFHTPLFLFHKHLFKQYKNRLERVQILRVDVKLHGLDAPGHPDTPFVPQLPSSPGFNPSPRSDYNGLAKYAPPYYQHQQFNLHMLTCCSTRKSTRQTQSGGCVFNQYSAFSL